MQDAPFSSNGAARRLGMVVGGSLTQGIEIKLDDGVSTEEMAVGRFVTIQGQRSRFFGVITDVSLATTDDRLAASPPDVTDEFIARVVSGTTAYGALHVVPYLMLDAVAGADGPKPAKTVPPHFALARVSDPAEVQLIFGENDGQHIWIGSPLDMEEAPVCLDAKRLVERSTGVFGKTGTGKSFLTRILLAQIVQKSDAVSLIFDMHNEYGWKARSEEGGDVKGLKQLFASRVGVFTLDPESCRARGITPDFTVRIGYDDIEADDIATLAGILGLSGPMVLAAQGLQKRHGRGWLRQFLKAESKDAIAAMGGDYEHEGVMEALRRKLAALERFPFLVEKAPEDSVARIMEYLDRGSHVVLEFGGFQRNLTAYILVANLLTRRIHARYTDRVDRAMGGKGEMPRPLIIAIEEAHKFLSPELSGQTTFGAIARELRKYNVTLLVIDQRPSGIDPEVMSQVGTKITCLLENDRDVDAVLAGVSGRSELRSVLAKLETKQQALIFGHAVPMPVVVRTRTYDADFYKSVGYREPADRRQDHERLKDDLFGPRR